MAAPNQEAVLKALADIVALGRNVGLPKVVSPLERFQTEFQTTKLTLKALQGPVDSAVGKAFLAIRKRVLDEALFDPRPGMKKHADEMERAFRAMSDATYPPEHPEIPEADLVGLAGNKETTTVIGDPKGAKQIAKQSLEVIRQFSKAVFEQDIETAYGHCAKELRTRLNAKRFVTELQKADTQFGGPAVDLMVERITWIYADEASRQRSNSNGDWPKDTPKSNKRALVGAFWFTNKKEQRGRWTFFWVTEEADGYRIAKFNQYLQ
jgi:hypothetical protein